MRITAQKLGLVSRLVALQATDPRALFVESLKILLDYAGWSDRELARRMGISRQWAWKRQSGPPKDVKLSTLEKICRAFAGHEPPITILPGDLFDPARIAQKVRPPVTDPDTPPSSYTPRDQFPISAKESQDVRTLAASVNQLERRFATLEEQLADNIAIIFAAYDTLRVRSESMRHAGESHPIPTGPDPTPTGTGGRAGQSRKYAIPRGR